MSEKRFKFIRDSVARNLKTPICDNGQSLTSEVVTDQKELQILIFQTIINLIDEKIDELQKQYDFGQEHGFCPMHNIMHSINVLKELKKELQEWG